MYVSDSSGRVAMLATIGYIAPEYFRLPGYCSPSAGLGWARFVRFGRGSRTDTRKSACLCRRSYCPRSQSKPPPCANLLSSCLPSPCQTSSSRTSPTGSRPSTRCPRRQRGRHAVVSAELASGLLWKSQSLPLRWLFRQGYTCASLVESSRMPQPHPQARAAIM